MAFITTEGWPVQIIPLKSSANYPISLSGHLVLVFKDDQGNEFTINAGPAIRGYPYGELVMRENGDPLFKRFNVVDNSLVDAAWRGSTRVDIGERLPSHVWDIFIQHAQNIHDAGFDYDGVERNSNAVIGSLLDIVGINVNDVLPDPRGVMLLGYVGKDVLFKFDYGLTGTSGDDFLRGRDGRQTFTGEGGNDHLIGGVGGDRLFGNAGRDLLIGGSGDDMLSGGRGNDVLRSDRGNDILHGLQGNDLLLGGRGQDRLFGHDGADTLRGGSEADSLSGGDGDDQLDGGPGQDTLEGGTGDDTLQGSAGDDLLKGQDGDDRLKGGDGDDVLRGGAGVDRLRGDAGADTFRFKTLGDSGRGGEADRVLGFESGEDVIDIEGLADGFVFAEDGFTGTGPSFTLDEADGHTKVQVDVDGDGANDLEILVKHVTGLGVDDFIF